MPSSSDAPRKDTGGLFILLAMIVILALRELETPMSDFARVFRHHLSLSLGLDTLLLIVRRSLPGAMVSAFPIFACGHALFSVLDREMVPNFPKSILYLPTDLASLLCGPPAHLVSILISLSPTATKETPRPCYIF